MELKPAALASKIGVSKQAVNDALARGRLVRTAAGLIDTADARNRDYLGRLTAHRKRERAEPSSPGAVAAKLRRARATYARQYAAWTRRRRRLFPAAVALAAERALLEAAAKGFRRLPRLDLADEGGIERELERIVSAILIAAAQAGRVEAHRLLTDERGLGEEAPSLPAEIPEGMPLTEARAALDELAAARIDLAHAEEAGAALPFEAVARRLSRLDGELGQFRSWPRRSAARLAATTPEERPARLAELAGIEAERVEARLAQMEVLG